jgi:hypothetical protein
MKMSFEESRERRKKIYENSPILYSLVGDRNATPRYSICYGIECGDGWLDIIDEASQKIEKLSLKKKEEDPNFDGFVIHQIKEKFGGLRLYVSKRDSEVDKIVMEAENACAVTCETCGNPGEVRRSSWLKNRCDDCERAYTTKNGDPVETYCDPEKKREMID